MENLPSLSVSPEETCELSDFSIAILTRFNGMDLSSVTNPFKLPSCANVVIENTDAKMQYSNFFIKAFIIETCSSADGISEL